MGIVVRASLAALVLLLLVLLLLNMRASGAPLDIGAPLTWQV
jgi:hypothetical protein